MTPTNFYASRCGSHFRATTLGKPRVLEWPAFWLNRMLEVHRELLWIGNAVDIRTHENLLDAEISAVVDVAYEELPAQLPRQLI